MIEELVGATTTRVCELSDVCWSEVSASELPGVLRQLEELSRRLEAINAAGAAEAAARAERAGRSVTSAATGLGRELGLTAGQCRSRVEAGRREGTPAMDSHRQGRITAAQERAIGEAVAELPEGTPDEARRDFSHHLTGLAEGGMSVRAITAAAGRGLAKADPGRLERLERQQQKRRDLRLQRAGLDALCHVLSLGLSVELAATRGVAAIVVRLTPEQLDAVEAGEQGGLAETDAGAPLSAAQAVSLAGRRSWFLSALRDGREEVRRIDVDRGRDRRLASAIQRLVLYAAHGGCTHPGCERPAAGCQAHHVVEWAEGGPTTVSNLALACPIHHGWIGTGPDSWRTVHDPARPGMPRWIPPGTAARAA